MLGVKGALYAAVLEYFRRTMPVAETELRYGSPFELLVAVMLSAQCTDRRVNEVTPGLFSAFPTVSDMAKATPEAVWRHIRSVSYPNVKARHLVEMSRMLLSDFGVEVPSTGEELELLPGVGRKTANVIQAVIFGKAKMPVDTHVFRVSHRIGLVPASCTTPLSVERELTENICGELLGTAHHWFILHGRYVCTARRPKCDSCGLNKICRNRQK